MKRLFLLVASVLLGGQAMAQQSVQGIDRPDLQGRKEIRKATLPERANASFTFDDIDFWVGDGPNKAAMVISWHDAVDDQPDHLVWGYRWLDGDTATGYKMLTAIAAKDPRFLALTQLTNLGYTIDGLGYDVAGRDTSTFKLKYVLGQEDPFVLGASTDTRVSFKFDTPNTTMGQYACPQNPLESANAAIQTGLATGIIEHPFNYGNYGYACYDYDYWQVDTVSYGGTPNLHWKAGWYNGYWSYFGGDGNPNSWSYSSWGASMRELNNGDWDGWSYNGDMNNWEGTLPGTDLVAAPAVVKVDKKSANISRGSTLNLSLTFDDKYTSGKNVVWTVSDSRVIRITSSDDNSVQIRAMSSAQLM